MNGGWVLKMKLEKVEEEKWAARTSRVDHALQEAYTRSSERATQSYLLHKDRARVTGKATRPRGDLKSCESLGLCSFEKMTRHSIGSHREANTQKGPKRDFSLRNDRMSWGSLNDLMPWGSLEWLGQGSAQ